MYAGSKQETEVSYFVIKIGPVDVGGREIIFLLSLIKDENKKIYFVTDPYLNKIQLHFNEWRRGRNEKDHPTRVFKIGLNKTLYQSHFEKQY